MCGFVGYVDHAGEPVDAGALGRALAPMRHRGPDASGVWQRGPAALAHCRLSIIDLDARSNQPFASDDGRFVLAYNGEIYNFAELRDELAQRGRKFRTGSDTEVLLAALLEWGEAALSRLNGMFAFALWDARDRELMLARDRFGVKPLYLDRSHPGSTRFASTMAPLLRLPGSCAELDTESVGGYLKAMYFPTGRSAVRGIAKLAPGGIMRVDSAGRVSERLWWQPGTATAREVPGDENDLVDLLGRLLRAAVKRRLVSDVPVGVLLSGGIDSSLVTAFMAQEKQGGVDSFTIGFQEAEHDESEVARSVAAVLGTRHHELLLRADDMLELIDSMPAYFDEPFADVSAIPSLVVSRLARTRVTVALCGDGGDELLAGYRYYEWGRRYARLYRALPAGVRRFALALAPVLPARAAMALGGLAQPDLAALFAYMRCSSKSAEWEDLLRFASAGIEQDVASEMVKWHDRDARRRMMAADYRTYLANDILVKGDRSAMAFSLEARHPFLDVEFVETALSIPDATMFRHGGDKWLLRRLLGRLVPGRISSRPKHGFTVPIRGWFRGRLRPMLEDHLSAGALQDDPVLRPAGVQRLLREHARGRRNHENLLWAMLMYRMWYRRIFKAGAA